MSGEAQDHKATTKEYIMTDLASVEKTATVCYCERCGAQIEGPGSWGHDDNCPKTLQAIINGEQNA